MSEEAIRALQTVETLNIENKQKMQDLLRSNEQLLHGEGILSTFRHDNNLPAGDNSKAVIAREIAVHSNHNRLKRTIKCY